MTRQGGPPTPSAEEVKEKEGSRSRGVRQRKRDNAKKETEPGKTTRSQGMSIKVSHPERSVKGQKKQNKRGGEKER